MLQPACVVQIAQHFQPPGKALARHMLEIAVERVAGGHIEMRERVADFFQPHIAAFGDLQRAGQHLRRVREDAAISRDS